MPQRFPPLRTTDGTTIVPATRELDFTAVDFLLVQAGGKATLSRKTEFFSANSATKTPGATNNYLLMTGNSVVLTSGSHVIHVLIDYGSAASPVDYTNSQLVFAAANGADTGVAPAVFSTLTGVTFDAGKEITNGLSIGGGANVLQLYIFSVIRYTLTQTQTFFAVPFVSAGTVANARVRTFIYIERLSA